MMGDIYSLDTPESVAVGYPIAGVGSRFLAILIDTVVQTLVSAALAIVMFVAGLGLRGVAGYVAFGIGTISIAAVLLGYFIFFEIIWNGQTPGKRAMRLRVILTSGYPVTPFAVLIRNILRLVDILPSLYAVGVITMIINRRSRRLGDLVAGTMVIKEGREGSLSALPMTQYIPHAPPVPAWTIPGGGYPGAGYPIGGVRPDLGSAEVYRLTREDEALIRGFLDRRATLSPQRRYELSAQIAAVIHARIGGVTPVATEAYLEHVLAARRS